MRRTSLVILSLALFLSIGGCCCYTGSQKAKVAPNSAIGGPSPAVYIDPLTLVAVPDPIHVKRGQVVHFYFAAGTDVLRIETGVLEDYGSDTGHVWGRVRESAPYGPAKYSISNATSGHHIDPTIIIDPIDSP